jgi:hypothetical protein
MRTSNDALAQHLVALPLDLVLQQLRVAVWTNDHRCHAWKKLNAVVVTTHQRKLARLLEDVGEGLEECVEERTRCSDDGAAR